MGTAVRNWSAKRSGVSITIEGKDAKGHPVKFKTNTISAARENQRWPSAQAEDGQFYDLT